MKHILFLNLLVAPLALLHGADDNFTRPFGAEFQNLDSLATGEWWAKSVAAPKNSDGQPPPPPMDVPRDQVVAFALYTVHGGVMKLSAQLYPLKPGEPREARLEVKRADAWVEIAKSEVHDPGWDAHFRINECDCGQMSPRMDGVVPPREMRKYRGKCDEWSSEGIHSRKLSLLPC